MSSFDSMTANSTLLLAAIAVPFFGALLLPFFARQPGTREVVSVTTAAVLFVIVLQLLDVFFDEGLPWLEVWEIMPGLSFTLALRPLGMLFALVASYLWFITTIYSIGYLQANQLANQTRFYVCFALAITATMGLAFADNLFTFFICYEMLTLSTYPLVTHKNNGLARHAGRLYLGILMGSSMGLLLPAILITWQVTGTLDFVRGGIFNGQISPLYTGLLLAMFILGIGKSALMPLHRWLPAVMVAPTPVSALLHAVAVVKAGVFGVIMVLVYVFGIEPLRDMASTDWRAGSWLVYLAGTTLVLASITALKLDNLKHRLAYSTISQLAYVVLGTALLAPLSLVGAMVHIAAHALGKITLFFAAGSIYTVSHKTHVSELDGIGKAMPWTMGAFTIGALSIIGLPPTIGFISKWYILLGAVKEMHYFALGALIISTLINAAYLLPIIHAAFFKEAKTPITHGEAPQTMLWAICMTAATTVILFFASDWILEITGEIVSLQEALHLP